MTVPTPPGWQQGQQQQQDASANGQRQFDFGQLYEADDLAAVNGMSCPDALIWYNRHGIAAYPAHARRKMLAMKPGYQFDDLGILGEEHLAHVHEAWQQQPDMRVAVICGAASDLVAIDVDDLTEWDKFRAEFGDMLPATAVQSTGRKGGGFHMLFWRGEADPELLKQGKWSDRYPHIELKTKCGLIAAPSLHESRKPYQWRARSQPADISLSLLERRHDEAVSGPARLPPYPYEVVPWGTMAVRLKETEAVYATWLEDPDPVPTRIVLTTYVANRHLDGDPVQTALVGGSGRGKTERINSVSGLPGVVTVSTLTGEAALLSASPARSRSAKATGGLLRQVGGRGLLVIKDFTTILSMNRDRRAEIIAALREIADGHWDRHYGADGGNVLSWTGHCGILAGSTTAIDTAHAVLGVMGTRLLFVRPAGDDLDQMAESALRHRGREEEMRAALAAAAESLVTRGLAEPFELTEKMTGHLVALANLVSQARSPVDRDYQGHIVLVGDAEAPTRIIKQLGQLWRAGGMIGMRGGEAWEMVRRAGTDSIPKLRRLILQVLGGPQVPVPGTGKNGVPLRMTEVPLPTGDVAARVRHPARTTLRALEDLTAHGVMVRYVEQREDGGAADVRYTWTLSEAARGWWDKIGGM